MELSLEHKPIAQIETDTLAVIVYSKVKPEDPIAGESANALNTATAGWITEAFVSSEFSGKALETTLLHRPNGVGAKRLLIIGGGKPERFGPAEMRKIAGTVLRTMKAKGCRSVCLVLDAELQTGAMVEAAAEGAVLGDFEPDQLKTDPKKNEKAMEKFTVWVSNENSFLATSLAKGVVVGEAQNLARTLINQPANVLTPMKLAEHAREIAREEGLSCEVLDEERMRTLGMGALLGVAQGSANKPCLIVVRYRPGIDGGTRAHLGLVGKGVTFDTGGVSIKPSEGMEKMKYDMGGAAAVLGAMRAIAKLKPAISVTAVVPSVENMVSSNAQRPGDIVTSYNGKTIEVLNTDAEGRLILADALTYAIRDLGCTHLVDAATLTGAIAVALAGVHAGLFSNDESMKERLLAASKSTGERMWPMPLDDEYKDMLKSAFADLPNISGGRVGGAITAAKFLEEFVEEKPWAHLDIAGTAWLDDGKPYLSKGPTGIPVRTFVRLACDWASAGRS